LRLSALIASVAAGTLLVCGASAQVPSTDEVLRALVDPEQIADQVQGEFGNLVQQRMPDGRIQRAWQGAAAGTAVLDADADASAEIKFRIRERAHTLVEWPAWESIASVDVGDTEAVRAELRQIGDAAPRHLVLYPVRPGRDTSVTVIGASGRSYLLYVQVESDRSTAVPAALVRIAAAAPRHLADATLMPARATGPAPAVAATKADWLEELAFDPAELDFNYTMAGNPAIAPQVVFSDGVFTYLYFGDAFKAVDLPVVSRVIDQIDSPVNSRVQGKTMVVESVVGDGLTLRLGQTFVCIRSSRPKQKPSAIQQTPLQPIGASASYTPVPPPAYENN
jgi:ComB9 competence protein